MRSGLGRVVRELLRSIHAEGAQLSELEYEALCERVTELVCMMAAGDSRPSREHLDDVVAAVRRHMREQVGQAPLRLTSVAGALGWSPRQLRDALERTGTTFRNLRQQESLRFARAVLADPLKRDTSIAETAAAIGYTPTWFASAFKARYGEAPREYRARMAAAYPAG